MRTKAKCHPEKVNHAFEMCWACYKRTRRANNLQLARNKEKQYRLSNPEKHRLNWRKWYKKTATPEWNKGRSLKQLYGISLENYQRLVFRQDGKCLICDEKRKVLHVDHDHKTKKIRGLLCGNCNTAIGLLHENPKVFEKTASYLRKHRN